jgi:hypothetical protein
MDRQAKVATMTEADQRLLAVLERTPQADRLYTGSHQRLAALIAAGLVQVRRTRFNQFWVVLPGDKGVAR